MCVLWVCVCLCVCCAVPCLFFLEDGGEWMQTLLPRVNYASAGLCFYFYFLQHGVFFLWFGRREGVGGYREGVLSAVGHEWRNLVDVVVHVRLLRVGVEYGPCADSCNRGNPPPQGVFVLCHSPTQPQQACIAAVLSFDVSFFTAHAIQGGYDRRIG